MEILTGVQKSGYRLHLVFLSTDNLHLLYNRIKERSLRGEHYVRPDVVEGRYFTSLRLLKHYVAFPDVVQLIDNTSPLTMIAVKKGSHWQILTDTLPGWVADYLAHHFIKQPETSSVKSLSSIEEVKQRYRQNKKG